jgi:hypothetical protein
MKKIVALGSIFIMLLFVNNHALAKGKNFFDGKWSVVIKATPLGDSKLTLILSSKSGKLQGYVIDKDGGQSEIEKVEVKGQKIIIYFTFNHFNVDLSMQKIDENHFVGKLKDRYDSEGVRLIKYQKYK